MNQYTGFGNTTDQWPPRCTFASSAGISRNSGSDWALSVLKYASSSSRRRSVRSAGCPSPWKSMIIDRVDAHGLQHRLERRRPLGTVRHRLHGVGEMPVRAQRLVSGEGGEAIAIGVAEHVRQRRFRCAVGHEEEDAHALGASGRRIHPRVVLPVLVAQLPHADAHAAAPRSVPRNARFEEKSRGKKYWCGAGNTATLPPAVFAASVL